MRAWVRTSSQDATAATGSHSRIPRARGGGEVIPLGWVPVPPLHSCHRVRVWRRRLPLRRHWRPCVQQFTPGSPGRCRHQGGGGCPTPSPPPRRPAPLAWPWQPAARRPRRHAPVPPRRPPHIRRAGAMRPSAPARRAYALRHRRFDAGAVSYSGGRPPAAANRAAPPLPPPATTRPPSSRAPPLQPSAAATPPGQGYRGPGPQTRRGGGARRGGRRRQTCGGAAGCALPSA